MKAADKTLAKRYARAYMGLDGGTFEHAKEESFRGKAQALQKALSAVEPYRKVLLHPVVNGAVKEEILEKVIGGAAAYGPARGFLEFLVRENRFFLVEEIVREAVKLFEEWCGTKKAEIYVRYDLGEAEVKRIERILVKAFGGKIRLTQVLTERVIGGFEIKMGDLLIDATAKGRLERLRKEIFKA